MDSVENSHLEKLLYFVGKQTAILYNIRNCAMACADINNENERWSLITSCENNVPG